MDERVYLRTSSMLSSPHAMPFVFLIFRASVRPIPGTPLAAHPTTVTTRKVGWPPGPFILKGPEGPEPALGRWGAGCSAVIIEIQQHADAAPASAAEMPPDGARFSYSQSAL